MSDKPRDLVGVSLADVLSSDEVTLKHELTQVTDASCVLDGEGHCITCSDEALPARVLHVDQEAGIALVKLEETTEEIDITLVEDVAPGDMLLVHGGVAIGHV